MRPPFPAALLPALIALTPAAAMAADRDHPAVVELFQSQGCSSCPPANAHVMALSARPDILALSFQVTYWDQLGWKDSFAQPAWTARQWDYAHGLGHAEVWTPQVVINGRADVVGVRPGEIEAALSQADRGRTGPAITVADGRIRIGAAPAAHPADVWLVLYDPQVVQIAIRRGENAGRTLPHKNVVRALTRLGRWTGATDSFVLPPPQPGLASAILVQDGPGGRILAAARA